MRGPGHAGASRATLFAALSQIADTDRRDGLTYYCREKNMRSELCLAVALSGLLGASAAFAAEYPIDIKTDLKGQYFVVEKGGTANNPTLLVKRVWPKGTYYVKRWFDCKLGTFKFLGEGDTLDAVAKSQPDRDTRAIEQGSIADQLAHHVCPK
jgi:hypothetical protein